MQMGAKAPSRYGLPYAQVCDRRPRCVCQIAGCQRTVEVQDDGNQRDRRKRLLARVARGHCILDRRTLKERSEAMRRRQ